MAGQKPQAISGVSAGADNLVMTVYPSVAASGIGRLLGSIYDSIPVRIFGVKLSNLLFTLPTIPLALLLYLGQKVVGVRYELKSNTVEKRASLGDRLISSVNLSDIDNIEYVQGSGQAFYHACDIVLRAANGTSLMKLEGISRGEVFGQTIEKTRAARRQVEDSLATIGARQSA